LRLELIQYSIIVSTQFHSTDKLAPISDLTREMLSVPDAALKGKITLRCLLNELEANRQRYWNSAT